MQFCLDLYFVPTHESVNNMENLKVIVPFIIYFIQQFADELFECV